MEYLAQLKWFDEDSAKEKLIILAENIEDPSAISQLEHDWVHKQ